MIPLKMLLPPQKPFFYDPVAPLGISFYPPAEPLELIDFEAEIAAMKNSLHMHPLIGSVVQASPQTQSAGTPIQTASNPPNAPRGRRSSVGGDRAQAIASQFEATEPEEEEDEYPESEVEYFESVSGDADTARHPDI